MYANITDRNAEISTTETERDSATRYDFSIFTQVKDKFNPEKALD